MKLIVTKDVGSHLINDNYECLLVQFENIDTHYHWHKKNWMPKDDEVFKIIGVMLNISPTFRERFEKIWEAKDGKND